MSASAETATGQRLVMSGRRRDVHRPTRLSTGIDVAFITAVAASTRRKCGVIGTSRKADFRSRTKISGLRDHSSSLSVAIFMHAHHRMINGCDKICSEAAGNGNCNDSSFFLSFVTFCCSRSSMSQGRNHGWKVEGDQGLGPKGRAGCLLREGVAPSRCEVPGYHPGKFVKT